MQNVLPMAPIWSLNLSESDVTNWMGIVDESLPCFYKTQSLTAIKSTNCHPTTSSKFRSEWEIDNEWFCGCCCGWKSDVGVSYIVIHENFTKGFKTHSLFWYYTSIINCGMLAVGDQTRNRISTQFCQQVWRSQIMYRKHDTPIIKFGPKDELFS